VGFNFEKLDVYEKSIDFANQVYMVTRDYPKEEMLGLTNQFRRAAVSISLNIAEGSARSKKDFIRFVDIARGSTFECVAILNIYEKLSFVNNQKSAELCDKLVEISKMPSGLKSSLALQVMINEL
jgi:four helix bundle protein